MKTTLLALLMMAGSTFAQDPYSAGANGAAPGNYPPQGARTAPLGKIAYSGGAGVGAPGNYPPPRAYGAPGQDPYAGVGAPGGYPPPVAYGAPAAMDPGMCGLTATPTPTVPL